MPGDASSSERAGSSPIVAGKVAEYLEKYAADGFKRESDQEENVVRSLPFFATSFGVLLAFLSLARSAMPAWSFAPLPLTAYALLALILISLLLLIWFLLQAVRPRDFQYPMQEGALVEYAKKLSGYYEQGRSTAPDNAEGAPEPAGAAAGAAVLERAVVEDLRAAVLTQLAAAAEISRRNNTKRLAARAGAFITLMTALIFALLLFVVILAADKFPGAFS